MLYLQIQDDDDAPNAEDQDGSREQRDRHDVVVLSAERIFPEMHGNSIAAGSQEVPLVTLKCFLYNSIVSPSVVP